MPETQSNPISMESDQIKPITETCDECGNQFTVQLWNKHVPPTCTDCWSALAVEKRAEYLRKQWPEVQIDV